MLAQVNLAQNLTAAFWKYSGIAEDDADDDKDDMGESADATLWERYSKDLSTYAASNLLRYVLWLHHAHKFAPSHQKLRLQLLSVSNSTTRYVGK